MTNLRNSSEYRFVKRILETGTLEELIALRNAEMSPDVSAETKRIIRECRKNVFTADTYRRT